MAHLFQAPTQTELYAAARPTYPPEVIQHILARINKPSTQALDLCVDIGCGSGQFTRDLSHVAHKVVGIDASQSQINQANQRNQHCNVSFMVADCNRLPFADSSVDLITAAQSYHWLDYEQFNREVDRCLRPGGCLALIVYGVLYFDNADEDFSRKASIHLKEFRSADGELGSFRDLRRDHVDDLYGSIALINYKNSHRYETCIASEWDLLRVKKYLQSWSAYQTFLEQRANVPGQFAEDDPLDKFISRMEHSAPDEGTLQHLQVRWPLHVLTFLKPEEASNSV